MKQLIIDLSRKLLGPFVILLACLFHSSIFYSCKQGWLDEKRDINLLVPTTLQDMRLLLNNTSIFRYDNKAIAELSSDDFYFTTDVWIGQSYLPAKNGYIWDRQETLFGNTTIVYEWDNSYKQVMVCNTVLEGLQKIEKTKVNESEYNDIKGSALFYRAKAFLNLADLFSEIPSEKLSEVEALGIPLRTSSAVDAPVQRSSQLDTYQKIASDLNEAAGLVKERTDYKTNPSKPAVFGLLARFYLNKGDYDKALANASLALQTNGTLLDYNSIDSTKIFPFSLLNEEVIFHSDQYPQYSNFSIPSGRIDSLLLKSYSRDDLRKTLFFYDNNDGSFSFKGSYSQTTTPFCGITTAEMYLVKAECNARKGNLEEAMEVLNTLLKNRTRKGRFVPKAITNSNDATETILAERRKELVFRGLRWMDLRRLNKEYRFKKTAQRMVDGKAYFLQPNDPRYSFPIPGYIIKASGIKQNNY